MNRNGETPLQTFVKQMPGEQRRILEELTRGNVGLVLECNFNGVSTCMRLEGPAGEEVQKLFSSWE